MWSCFWGQLYGNTLFFRANDGVNGLELWKSDGTEAGTMMVKDINPNGDASVDGLTAVGNTLYFAATDQTGDRELWKSDGTANGTQQVKDIHPSASSSPQRLVALGNTLYFFATDNTNRLGLWKSNGTDAGTRLVKNLPSNVSYIDYFISSSTRIYFIIRSGFTWKLWVSDGTTATTKEVMPIDEDYGTEMQIINQILYFVAPDPADGIPKLQKSDGTIGGTVIIKDLQRDGYVSIENLMAFNNLLYFVNDGLLWKSDGTETGTVMVNNAEQFRSVYLWAAWNEILYFQAESLEYGVELWKTNGATDGATQVKDINAIGNSADPWDFTLFKGILYFSADDGIHGRELWKSDGTSIGTVLVKDINADGSSDIDQLLVMNNVLYFRANDGINGDELWRSDGTAEGTWLVKDIRLGIESHNNSSELRGLMKMGNLLFFMANDGINDHELWKSDGTAEGTVIVKNINPGSIYYFSFR